MVVVVEADAFKPVGAVQGPGEGLPNTWNSFIEYPFEVPLVIPLMLTNLALTGLLNTLCKSILPLTVLTVIQFIPSCDIFKSKSFPIPEASQLMAILQISKLLPRSI